MDGLMSVQPSDPTAEEVALAVALATLDAHHEVAADGESVCATCDPLAVFPCVYVVQAKRTLDDLSSALPVEQERRIEQMISALRRIGVYTEEELAEARARAVALETDPTFSDVVARRRAQEGSGP